MAEDALLYERRRYSAVVMSHEGLGTFSAVSKVAGPILQGQKRVPKAPRGWDLRRVELYGKRSYPENVSVPSSKVRDDQVGHDSYIGVHTPADGSGPLVLVAAPYRRLLHSTVEKLAAGLDRPTPTFASFRMDRLFDALLSEPDDYRATRITVQTAGEPGVALVSLSGVSPLRSGLWNEIRDTVTPYGARVHKKYEDGSVRLHTDRLGNLFWHQLNELSTARVCAAVGYLLDLKITRMVDVSPLTRTTASDDDTYG
jgi:hypothetical protein